MEIRPRIGAALAKATQKKTARRRPNLMQPAISQR
jgi:hypothetical protein